MCNHSRAVAASHHLCSKAKSVNGAEQHPGWVCVRFRLSLLRKEELKQKYLQRRATRILGSKESLWFWNPIRNLRLVEAVWKGICILFNTYVVGRSVQDKRQAGIWNTVWGENQKSSLLMSLDWPSSSCGDGKYFKLNLAKFLVGPAWHWWYQGPAAWLWPPRSCYPFLYVLKYNCR